VAVSSRLPLGEERANILLLACCYQEGWPRAAFAQWMSGHKHRDPKFGHVYNYHSRSELYDGLFFNAGFGFRKSLIT
jgi:hypothetical protein